MDGPLQRPPDKGQDEGIRRRRTQPEPGALPTLAPSKWVAEGRKGDLSRACIQLNPQSQTPKAKAIQALENSDPDDGIHIQTWCAAKKGSALTAGSLCFDKVTKPFALTSGPGKPGFPHADIVEGGPRRRAIHGPTALSRHPCRSTPSTTPAFGLPYARLASSVRWGFEDQGQRQRRG